MCLLEEGWMEGMMVGKVDLSEKAKTHLDTYDLKSFT